MSTTKTQKTAVTGKAAAKTSAKRARKAAPKAATEPKLKAAAKTYAAEAKEVAATGLRAMEPILDRARNAADEARATGRNLWLAGLGVVATASDESRAAFERLVDKGNRRERERLSAPVREAAERVKNAGAKLEAKVEAEIEARVSATLTRLGVPTRRDFERLIDKIEALAEKVERRSEAA